MNQYVIAVRAGSLHLCHTRGLGILPWRRCSLILWSELHHTGGLKPSERSVIGLDLYALFGGWCMLEAHVGGTRWSFQVHLWRESRWHITKPLCQLQQLWVRCSNQSICLKSTPNFTSKANLQTVRMYYIHGKSVLRAEEHNNSVPKA